MEETEILAEFQKEGEATEAEVDEKYNEAIEAIEDLEFRSTLNKEEDELGVILEINAGAGVGPAKLESWSHLSPIRLRESASCKSM